MTSIKVIIPAFNEEQAIGKVLQAIPNEVQEVIVVDNGSSDNTGEVAKNEGANVIHQPLKGYGNACLAGIQHMQKAQPDIVVFMDADYSDFPEELPRLVAPILDEQADLVIGSRVLGRAEKNALTIQQRFGNWLATRLISLFWGVYYSDLGPFRAIRYPQLIALEMKDKNYGWTVEMQIKAAKKGLKCMEIPVSYRRRIGTSKVSGTVKGTILAGLKIIWTIFKNI